MQGIFPCRTRAKSGETNFSIVDSFLLHLKGRHLPSYIPITNRHSISLCRLLILKRTPRAENSNRVSHRGLSPSPYNNYCYQSGIIIEPVHIRFTSNQEVRAMKQTRSVQMVGAADQTIAAENIEQGSKEVRPYAHVC